MCRTPRWPSWARARRSLAIVARSSRSTISIAGCSSPRRLAMVADSAAYRRIATLMAHEGLLLRRAPGPLIGYTIMPLLLMVVLQPTLERLSRVSAPDAGGTGQAAAGMAVMFSLFALKLVGADVLQERTWQ